MHAAFALIVGLAEREATGRGCLLEVTMVEGALNAAAELVLEATAYGNLLDHLTVGLGQMDAVAAMAQPTHEVNSDFATPPFLYIEREMPGIKPIITMKEILGENGTIGTSATTTRFRTTKPELYKVLHAALTEAMGIIAADKGRAVDGYLGATGDKKTTRDMLLKIANDPDVEFTMTPRAMKSYAEFIYKTGTIKRLPDKWSDLFFGETGALSGS